MRRPSVSASDGGSILAQQDPDAWKEWPGLRSFFLSTRYDGVDAEREPGCLIVRPEASRWVWTLKDPTAATQLMVHAPTWDEVQLLAEALLLDERAPWVVDQWAKQRKGKGRK